MSVSTYHVQTYPIGFCKKKTQGSENSQFIQTLNNLHIDVIFKVHTHTFHNIKHNTENSSNYKKTNTSLQIQYCQHVKKFITTLFNTFRHRCWMYTVMDEYK